MKAEGFPQDASSFILHPSSFILYPSSFILYRSSFILHPSSFILGPRGRRTPTELLRAVEANLVHVLRRGQYA
jgi:hypothetical protein